MNFQTVTNKKDYYLSLNEMIKDHRRKDIINSLEPTMSNIKQEMFDKWNVDNIYITGEILEKNRFNTDSVTLYIEIKKDMFEDLVDSYWIENHSSVKFLFNVNEVIWEWKDNRWKDGGFLPDYKLLL